MGAQHPAPGRASTGDAVPRAVSQSVKEVLQSLVDDSLVDTEKIGTSVYFWAFPSKAAQSVGPGARARTRPGAALRPLARSASARSTS